MALVLALGFCCAASVQAQQSLRPVSASDESSNLFSDDEVIIDDDALEESSLDLGLGQDLHGMIDDLKRRILALETQSERQEKQIKALEAEQALLKSRLEGLEAHSFDANADETQQNRTTEAVDPDDLLARLQQRLADGEDPASIEGELKALMKSNPDYNRTAVVLYFLGETFLLRQRYAEASTNYASSYQKSAESEQSSERAAASLYKLSLSLGRQGERAKACLAIEKLQRDYTSLPERLAVKASQLAEDYGCNDSE